MPFCTWDQFVLFPCFACYYLFAMKKGNRSNKHSHSHAVFFVVVATVIHILSYSFAHMGKTHVYFAWKTHYRQYTSLPRQTFFFEQNWLLLSFLHIFGLKGLNTGENICSVIKFKTLTMWCRHAPHWHPPP